MGLTLSKKATYILIGLAYLSIALGWVAFINGKSIWLQNVPQFIALALFSAVLILRKVKPSPKP